MQSYILRRKRWYQLCVQLDKELSLTDEHLGDLLLDAANLADWQRQMILTSTANTTSFSKIEEALMQQLSDAHKRESRSTPSSPSRPGKGKGKEQRGKTLPPRFRRSAFISGLDDEDWYPDEDAQSEETASEVADYDDEVDDATVAASMATGKKGAKTRRVDFSQVDDPNNLLASAFGGGGKDRALAPKDKSLHELGEARHQGMTAKTNMGGQGLGYEQLVEMSDRVASDAVRQASLPKQPLR